MMKITPQLDKRIGISVSPYLMIITILPILLTVRNSYYLFIMDLAIITMMI